MLEIIGLLTTLIITWIAIKKLIKVAIGATLKKAEAYATDHGVLRTFARSAIEDFDTLKAMRIKLSTADDKFSDKKIHQQYGIAIVELFSEHELREGITEGVGAIVNPQIEQLLKNKEFIPINEITLAYIGALIIGLTAERKVTLEQVEYTGRELFRQEALSQQFDNALAVASKSPDFVEKVKKLLPIAENEAKTYLNSFSNSQDQSAAKAPDYLIRYAKFHSKQIEALMQNAKVRDLRTEPPVDFVNI